MDKILVVEDEEYIREFIMVYHKDKNSKTVQQEN